MNYNLRLRAVGKRSRERGLAPERAAPITKRRAAPKKAARAKPRKRGRS